MYSNIFIDAETVLESQKNSKILDGTNIDNDSFSVSNDDESRQTVLENHICDDSIETTQDAT